MEQLLVETPPLARLRVLLAAGPDSEWGLRMAQILAAAGATVKHSDQVSTRARRCRGQAESLGSMSHVYVFGSFWLVMDSACLGCRATAKNPSARVILAGLVPDEYWG